MPRATTNIGDTQEFELRSCPGGKIKLRRMNYGEMLERRAMSGKMNMNLKGGKATAQDLETFIQLANRNVTEFEFRSCIVEHNLEDDNGQLLDFRSPMTLNVLDPRIGDEISSLIDNMNQFEADLGNSKNGSVLV